MNFERIELLIGEKGVKTLQDATVMVVGIGGVGSFCAEALARSGIGHLVLVDGDKIDETNLNRQIHATDQTVGKSKVEMMKQRIHSYYQSCNVEGISFFYDASKNEELFQYSIDFVVDAIDTISSKIDLIEACKLYQVPFISSMGMANRNDPTQIEVMDLKKTTYDPLARIMRGLVKKKRIKGAIPVVCSKEKPFVQHEIINEEACIRKQKMPPASTIFVPATAGLTSASYVVRKLLEKESV